MWYNGGMLRHKQRYLSNVKSKFKKKKKSKFRLLIAFTPNVCEVTEVCHVLFEIVSLRHFYTYSLPRAGKEVERREGGRK